MFPPDDSLSKVAPVDFMSHQFVDVADNGISVAQKQGIKGTDLIALYVAKLTNQSGVYRMLDDQGQVLYVGKAKSLKKRVKNYTQLARNSLRIQRMISQTHSMEFLMTKSEVEALLLEASLIKSLKPRYNILLRDDKSFPHILIRHDHDYPQVVKHRGKVQSSQGQYFGPFANANAVNETIESVQKAFQLRDCTDHTFATRDRPCLNYQIKRCSAPCVGKISQGDYQKSVAQATDFLRGNSQKIIHELTQQMQACAENLDYEQAGVLRDRIRALSFVQGTATHATLQTDADVFAIASQQGHACIQVFFYRGGMHFGNKSWFPNCDKDMTDAQILQAFIGQFYQTFECPKTVLVNVPLDANEQDMLASALSIVAHKQVQIIHPQRGDKATVVKTATHNAEQSLNRTLSQRVSQHNNLSALAELLGLSHPIERIEVYDNSHIQGASAVGAMIVAGVDGFVRQDYRKYTIKNTDSLNRNNDDFAMMQEVLTRRFKRLQSTTQGDKDTSKNTPPIVPDVVILDGGKGQLSTGQAVLQELGITDVTLMSIAKGQERESGRETLHFTDRADVMLRPDDPLSYFLQRLRDESHRYVIGTHRAKRTKDMLKNPLDSIAGVGAKRRKALMLHFGSAQNVAKASPDQIANIAGISKALAEKIVQELS